jgi:siroheme synthase
MGKVYLIGAGPGDPDLLTVKAARLLARATIVLHDSLVSREVLQLIPREAEIIDVGKRAGQKLLTQDEINQLLISYANQCSGRSLDRSADKSSDRSPNAHPPSKSTSHNEVIRLKGGDPVVFGRAGEEIEALRRANVPFEIVPGITAALGAAASAGISLTDRRAA